MKLKIQIILLLAVLQITGIVAHSDPLPSWNEGSTKNAILNYMKEITQEGGANYIALQDRIATFDEDGTMWVEQPLYTEYVYSLERVKALAPDHPEWKTTEPFKSILTGDFEAVKDFDMHDIELLIGATHAGMTIEQFHQEVRNWLKVAQHPRFKKPYTELVYQPMLEVMQFFKDNQFQVYIVSGGGQEFMRSFAEKLYGLPSGHIIGTTGKVKYEYRDGHPVLLKLPEVLFINDKVGKPAGINLVIGKRPVAAFGNSIGDQQMLEWTQSNKLKTIQLLVHHDDAVREYAYGPNSKIGTFSNALMEEANKRGWVIISMKNDWKVIFTGNTEKDRR